MNTHISSFLNSKRDYIYTRNLSSPIAWPKTIFNINIYFSHCFAFQFSNVSCFVYAKMI